jgi:hypothetical protein
MSPMAFDAPNRDSRLGPALFGLSLVVTRWGRSYHSTPWCKYRTAQHALWRFVRQHQGVIARNDPAGDVRITLDFSHIISPGYLDAESARIGSSRGTMP